MGATENFTLAENASFKMKVSALMRKSSLAIIGEVGLPSTAIEKRQRLAESALNDRERKVEYKFCHSITSLGTLTEASTDSDIEFTINSVFSKLAGVSAFDLRDYLAQTSRALTFEESELLADDLNFVGIIEGAILNKAATFRSTFGTADWATMTDKEKRQYNFAVEVLEEGSLDSVFQDVNKVGAAKTFLIYLINSNTAINIPDDGFNIEKVIDNMEAAGIFVSANIDTTYTALMKDVLIIEKGTGV